MSRLAPTCRCRSCRLRRRVGGSRVVGDPGVASPPRTTPTSSSSRSSRSSSPATTSATSSSSGLGVILDALSRSIPEREPPPRLDPPRQAQPHESGGVEFAVASDRGTLRPYSPSLFAECSYGQHPQPDRPSLGLMPPESVGHGQRREMAPAPFHGSMSRHVRPGVAVTGCPCRAAESLMPDGRW